MPPFSLPGEHFAAGLVWLGIGAAGLVAVADELARGAFLAPRVIAVTHCFTLGWIATSIFGALYQLFPVVLGVPARSVSLGHATFWTLSAGVATLVTGAWLWQPTILGLGWFLVFLAVGGVSWNLLPQRRRAPRGRVIGLYVSAGHVGLGLAMALAAARIGDTLGWWRVDRLGLLAAHAHLAAVAFATMTVIGVGSRLLPMFLLTRSQPAWPLRWTGPVTFLGVTALAVGQTWDLPILTAAGGTATAAGLFLYVYLARQYFRRRTRRTLDPGLAQVAAAFGFLAVATALGLFLLFGPQLDVGLMTAYAIVGLMGWLSLLIAGMYYKILPFLTWLNRFSPRVGQPGLPKVADLTQPTLAWASLILLTGGVTLLAISAALGSVIGTTVGASVFAAGVATTIVQYVRLAVTR